MHKVDSVVTGTVATQEGIFPNCCVVVDGGRIVGILSTTDAPEAEERMDYPDCLILPGMLDAHLHALGSETEGFTNATGAAAAGGVTTIIDMPTDLLGAVLTPQYLEEKMRAGESQCIVDFALWGAVNGENIDQIDPLARAGVVGFKMFMSESQRMGRINDGSLLLALEEIARIGGVAAVHAESFEITQFLTAKYRKEGRTGPEMHLAARPDVAETEAVLRAVEYARWAGADLHFVHLSLARSVDYVWRQRVDYPRLTVETCPHYLLLSDETVKRVGAFAKINPPLRKAGESELLWDQVRLGRVDLIGTDHAPYQPSDKSAANIFDNKSGVPGLETMLPLLYSEGVVRRQLPVEKMVSLLSSGPARRFGLYPRKGALMPGSDADLVVLDPREEWVIAAGGLHQASGWTPYEGMRVKGKPVLTMVRGQVVYRHGEITGTPGFGRFVASSHASRAARGG